MARLEHARRGGLDQRDGRAPGVPQSQPPYHSSAQPQAAPPQHRRTSTSTQTCERALAASLHRARSKTCSLAAGSRRCRRCRRNSSCTWRASGPRCGGRRRWTFQACWSGRRPTCMRCSMRRRRPRTPPPPAAPPPDATRGSTPSSARPSRRGCAKASLPCTARGPRRRATLTTRCPTCRCCACRQTAGSQEGPTPHVGVRTTRRHPRA